ncbi:ubiquinone biosynthesis monooxygenase Coq7 [Talaromyces marneffei ATCC 18224]|uniref:5-demethoxyubiquinone hydroxylase, mitochondrial n=2 Tax=Talaromyces marneffei TaxID=37727 RepID=B6QEW2_TALMQ|nr:uncharacterized protein EYB26_005011 [Talaromyces marneffei]EEA25017.1 ubiquinone biosynthesis protein Coq7, putative [Talaromyces marneffei ATCC 18224]KAE8552521.1 hypothetical protein EYB25_003899 [Talaromyces marneffei]QGA17340.1 hypothetical protein EYB26_005011 [Talaromyces marneffei]
MHAAANPLRCRSLRLPNAALSAQTPLYLDFLAPITLRRSHRRRFFFSARSSTKDAPESLDPVEQNHSSPSTKPRYVLSRAQREYLDRALRVNQAGELAATLIYAAQKPPIVRSHPHLRSLMKHMYDQEAVHFANFNHLVAKHQVRPTAMYPVWEVAATFLGWSTAVMGREAAMACTEAVETEIGTHYNEQVSTIMGWMKEAEQRGEEVDEEIKDLLALLRKTRDEELEHLDHAVENDSKEAKPYDPLVNIIRTGCRAAINISERI